MIYAGGLYESRENIAGCFWGHGLFPVGKFSWNEPESIVVHGSSARKGTRQPVLLGVVGFFALVAFAGRGELSDWMGMLSVAYLFLLPGYLLGATIYNLSLRPKRIQEWARQFLCQRCGAFAFGEEDGTRLRLRAIL